jgi:hypothetical protein
MVIFVGSLGRAVNRWIDCPFYAMALRAMTSL